MGQEQIQRSRTQERQEEHSEVEVEMPATESNVDLKEIDRLLDEIDLVLEANPVEFVDQYQQRGGQ
jgi:ubiquitin-like protein Pup